MLLSADIAAAGPPSFQVQDKSVSEGQLLTFAVSATDPDGDNIVYGIRGLPEGASFTDGSGQNAGKKIFSWTPDHSDAGAYPVSFSATDGTSVVYSNITITVADVNRDPALAVIGPRSVSENSLLTFTLLATDTDNSDLTFSSPNLPKNANINAASGVFQWTPSYDQSGVYQVEFVVSDGKGQDSEHVTIAVNNANLPPVFSPIADLAVNEDTLLEITFTASDPDGDALAFSKNVPLGTISGNKFSWKPSYEDAGEHSIELTVSDGDKKETQTAKVTVINVNRQPVLYSIPDVSARENEQITIQLAASDPDGDTLTYYSTNGLPDGAEFNAATGLFKWTPTTTYYEKIEFNVGDGSLYSRSKGVIVAVGAPVSTPEMAPIPNQQVKENETLSFIISATNGGSGSLSYFGDYPASATLESATGKFTWVPSYNDAGKHTMDFGVYDSDSRLTDYRTATVEVINVNRAPTIKPAPARLVNEMQAFQIPLDATDPDGDSLTFRTNISYGTLRGSTFIWTPGYSDAGDHYVEFTASDGSLSATTTAAIIVYGTNMPPKFDTVGPKETAIGSTLEFTVSSSDGDGDLLAFSASGLPSGASFDTSSRVFKWTPSASQKGTYSVSFKVSDGKLNDYQTVAVTVREPSSSGSSGGGGGGSGGSGGGGGSPSGSGEEYENVEFKDYSIRYIMKDKETVYSFTKEDCIITNVSLTTRLNGGQTKTVVELLKDKSSLVGKSAPGLVYRNVNIWVGDEKFSPESISDASVEFRVEKGWIEDNNVDAASIKLLRYADRGWSQLSTDKTGEDETYVYYVADTPDFSMFSISSMDEKAQQEISDTIGQGVLQPGGDLNSTMSPDDATDPADPNPVKQERKSSGIVYLAMIGLTALGVISYRYRVFLGKTIAQLGNMDGKRYRRFKR